MLTLAGCQLAVGGDTVTSTAPQKLPQPEVIISLELSASDWETDLRDQLR
ncbi:MAG: hypothetical protein QGI86_09400 [Candidatus Poribacteria bacterium]|nr:hypothetical protein [Candidatus Poribacteria bacterium]MDP6748299.1 hypothetical protein [Candidatus Poribacteria bacterium]MDP6994915.1 hypothetical protein [Candidatus Poribacteria bacterium]